MLKTALHSATLLIALLTTHLVTSQSSTSNATKPTCTEPTGLANTIVPVPDSLEPSFQVAPDFASAHEIFAIVNLPATLSEASIATYCLEQCVVFQGNNAAQGPCLSFNVNLGFPLPPNLGPGPQQFFCVGYDAFFAGDGSSFLRVDIEGSYLYPVSVNRVCNGTFRAY